MEFHEKLQELRRRKGLTQEELAAYLYVSRAAVSKWESGRGYPNIDSLKAVAKFFGVTVDELLSSHEVLNIAEEDQKEKESRFRDLVFGLLDCSMALFLFLPLFREEAGGMIRDVSLPALTEIEPYLKAMYLVFVVGMMGLGVLVLTMQNWKRNKHLLSLIGNGAGLLLFIVSLHPYGAALLFVFLMIKVFLLIKQP